MDETVLENNIIDAKTKLLAGTLIIQEALEKSFKMYYSKESTMEENRDAAFMKDLFDSLIYIEMLSREYLKDKSYPAYMIEKLEQGKSQWDSALAYFKNKQKKGEK